MDARQIQPVRRAAAVEVRAEPPDGAALEAEARRAGARAVRLDTNRVLHEAKALYLSLGYREVEPSNAEPVAHHWFAKDL